MITLFEKKDKSLVKKNCIQVECEKKTDRQLLFFINHIII